MYLKTLLAGRGGGGGHLQKKKWCLGGLKESLPQVFAFGAYYVSCQKRLCKMEFGFEGSITNVRLGLFSQTIIV